MAKLYITELQYAPRASGGLQIGKLRGAKDQAPIAISGAAALSVAFATSTKFVRVHADAICSIAYVAAGDSNSASANNMRLPADTIEYFGVEPGDKISVISNT